MWNWSKHQADRAVAASFTAWRHRDPEPTVTDPEFDETPEEGREQSGDTAAAGYAETPDGACEDLSEDALAGLFDALSIMLEAVPGVR
ncbi:hypothetical protein ACFROC_10430 [Nocardia tengchongensis]|uniref:hypothetical protein n=1 Tax=Nocardia tengchongensis TaxID=2055889 RepID=UPI00368D917F